MEGAIKSADVKNKLLERRLGSKHTPLVIARAPRTFSNTSASTIWSRADSNMSELSTYSRSSSATSESATFETEGFCRLDTYPTLDGYDGLDKLGRGTFAVVYMAKRQSDGKDVALKHVSGLQDSESVAAARKEFLALQSFRHPHIIQAFDFLEAIGSACLVLEYYEGLTLAKAAKRQPFPEPVAVQLFLMLAGAVLALHERSFVHCDIKPDNIMVSKDFTDLRLIDFNSAQRLEGAALTMTGTPLFQPPEVQHGFESPSELSDIWSLGLSLYFMLTGRLPRSLTNGSGARLQLDSALWEGLSESCKRVLNQCLSIDKKNRAGIAMLLSKEWPPSPETTFERSPSLADPGMDPTLPWQLPTWARAASR